MRGRADEQARTARYRGADTQAAVLPSEMIEVALPNRIEPLAGSLDLPEGPTVAGHADRVLIALVGAVAMEPEAVSMLPSGRMLA